MDNLNIVLTLFFILDMFFTYYNIRLFRKKYPEKDYSKMELNPIPKYFWNKLGLLYGGILSVIFFGLIIYLLVFKFPYDIKLILIGIYFVIIGLHLSNLSMLKKKKETKKGWTKWRKVFLITILILSLIDLGLTYNYINEYSNWQINKPFNEMEQNILLVYLWNVFGLKLGMVIGALIIWSLLILISRSASWIILISLLAVFIFGIVINIMHTIQLYDLIKLYPLGYIS